MSFAEAAEVLRRFNAWRRDADEEHPLGQLDPWLVGLAIDTAISALTAPPATLGAD